jgi:hypothetical protein
MLIVEDGSIVANANSFVDDTEALAIAEILGVTLAATPELRETDLKKGANYITVKCLKGIVVEQFQDMPYPRAQLYFKGFLVPSDVILKEVKYAQVAGAAYYADGADTAPVDDGKNIQKEKLDVLETTYFDNGKTTSGDKLTGADQWLKGLTCSTRTMKLVRC